jgi:type IV pilus assembly protein PilW
MSSMYNPKIISSSAARSHLQICAVSTNSQRGATLIELMIGIVIGLLVVLAATGSLVYTHVSSTTMVDATRLQQKADTAFRMIGFQALQAGAIELVPTIDPNTVIFSTAYTGVDPSVTVLPTSIVSVHGQNDVGTNKDILRLSYEDNGRVRDCLGQTSATPTRVDNEFAYLPAAGGGGELLCKGAAAGATAQPILDGVEDFQVTYGVRTVSAAGVESFRYFDAGAAGLDWTNVQTVNVCLQLRGETRGNPRPGYVGIAACGTVNDANDGYLRRVYRRTFSLRNTLS